MKTNRHCCLGLVLVLLATRAHSAVYLNVSPLSEPTSEAADMSRMVVTVDGQPVAGVRVALTFAQDQGEIEKSVTVSAAQVPKPYTVVPVKARIPFYRENQTLDMHALMIDLDSLREDDALNLLQKYKADMTTRERFEHYARARILAMRVLGKANPAMSARNEARAVFSFLRLASDLAETRNLQIDDFVDDSVTWLRDRLQDAPNVVENATQRESNEVEDLVLRLRGIETRRFEQLYTRIIQLGDKAPGYCPLMKSAQDEIVALPDDANRFRGIDQVRSKIQTAYAPCTYALLLAARGSGDSAVRQAAATEGEVQADLLLRVDRAAASDSLKQIARAQHHAIKSITKTLRVF
jgi:hypothetical protein